MGGGPPRPPAACVEQAALQAQPLLAGRDARAPGLSACDLGVLGVAPASAQVSRSAQMHSPAGTRVLLWVLRLGLMRSNARPATRATRLLRNI
jgi:hypothetical protein